MSQMNYLIKRHLKVFFKNKLNVFFTFLSPLMIIFIYLVVIARVIQGSYNANIGKYNADYARCLTDITLLSGLVSSASFTTALGLCSIIVSDNEKKIVTDFNSAPLTSSQIKYSYLFFNLIFNFLITLGMYLLGIAYMAIRKDFDILKIEWILLSIVYLFIGCLLGSLITVWITSYVRKQSTYGLISSLLGSLFGFAIGAFIPLNIMPNVLSNILNMLPHTSLTIALKDVASRPIQSELIAHMPADKTLYDYGLNGMMFNNKNANAWYCLANIATWTIIFALILAVNKKQSIKN